jgi:hypothetical protein
VRGKSRGIALSKGWWQIRYSANRAGRTPLFCRVLSVESTTLILCLRMFTCRSDNLGATRIFFDRDQFFSSLLEDLEHRLEHSVTTLQNLALG